MPPRKFPIFVNISIVCDLDGICSYWSTAKPECSSESLLRSGPPIACDNYEDSSNNALHEAKKKAYDHDAGKVEAQSYLDIRPTVTLRMGDFIRVRSTMMDHTQTAPEINLPACPGQRCTSFDQTTEPSM